MTVDQSKFARFANRYHCTPAGCGEQRTRDRDEARCLRYKTHLSGAEWEFSRWTATGITRGQVGIDRVKRMFGMQIRCAKGGIPPVNPAKTTD